MHVEKLDLLIQLLKYQESKNELDSEYKFDMNHFVIKGVHECKTSCCAGGLAALSGKFNRLAAEQFYGFSYDVIYYNRLGQRLRNYVALASCFGLNDNETHFIFDPYSYTDYNYYSSGSSITPQKVINRIKDVINGECTYVWGLVGKVNRWV